MEEIIYEWEEPTFLVLNLMSPSELSFDVRKELNNLAPHEPGLITSFTFNFLDARGNRVEFPLRLVSDTNITHTSPPLPPEPEQSG